MDPPPLDNKTGFAALPHVLLDKDGEKLCSVVKATFELHAGSDELEPAPAARARGIRAADVPWGKPEVSSIAYPSDLCLRKPGTDVIVVARAHAPDGRAVPSFDAGVKVGALRKALRIFGFRVWHAGGEGLSDPSPIEALEVRYDFAWGGVDDSDPGDLVEEARNPVGMGVARDAGALTHKPAPSIEDPAEPIRTFRTRPAPAGIGAIGRHWEPRRRFAGTFDAAWLESRAPLMPVDMDDRFNHCASPGLVAERPLVGGEACGLFNLTPGGGARAFSLPRVGAVVEVAVKGRPREVITPHLDTVLIDALEAGADGLITVELVWRAVVRAPRRARDARVTVREREVR